MAEIQIEKIKPKVKSDSRSPNNKPKIKVAYTMSRFPKLTETFILYEILALEKMGVKVELFPLIREKQAVVHPEAAKMVKRTRFLAVISLPIIYAHLYYMIRKTKSYFKTLVEVFAGTFGSLNFFLGAIGLYPKTVRIAYEMEKLGVTHLHAHFASHPALAAFIIHRLTGISYSFTAHGSDLHKERRMLGKKVAAAAFAVTISNFNKKVILDECGDHYNDKINIVHCGVDTKEFKPVPKNHKNRPFQILCVASFEEVKGHKYVVEACQILDKEGFDFQCHFIGYGPLKQKVKKQILEAGLQNKITIHDAMPRPAVIQMLSEADVKVLASVPTKAGKREGIPVVLMEAMAMGLPVVSSQLSGIPELVENGESGILVEPRDVIGLVDALKLLCGDAELRKKMGSAGREKVLREFNLHKNAEKLTNLFLSSISKPGGSFP